MKIYCKSGQSAEALEILEIMRDEHIHPNEITYLPNSPHCEWHLSIIRL